MDETEAVNHPVRAGSLHLRHDVHEHHGIDPTTNSERTSTTTATTDATLRTACDAAGTVGDWSVRHGSG
ncbi:MAG TPA: hypothetical protein VF874_21935, partial [Mycobacterium sp.]